MVESMFNPNRVELNNILEQMFKDKDIINRVLITLCENTKTPICNFNEYNERKSLLILKYLDKFFKLCPKNPDKCKYFSKGCTKIGICKHEGK